MSCKKCKYYRNTNKDGMALFCEYYNCPLCEIDDECENFCEEKRTNDDLISRQAVLDLAKDLTFEGGCKHRCVDVIKIYELPSYNSIKTELNEDLISRTELLNKIWQKEYGKDYDGVNLLNIKHIDIIENMPSIKNK